MDNVPDNVATNVYTPPELPHGVKYNALSQATFGFQSVPRLCTRRTETCTCALRDRIGIMIYMRDCYCWLIRIKIVGR